MIAKAGSFLLRDKKFMEISDTPFT